MGGLKVIIAGAPASGKGTQCEYIKERYGLVHLSTGDMLREAVSNGSEVGRIAKGYMDNGQLVPDNVIIGVVQERLRQPDCQRQGWLLDGFPRTGAQADALSQNGIFPDAFVYLDVPDAVLVERVVGRRLDPVTGKIYHMKFSPPPTSEIAARLTQRSDDTEEKVQVRLQAFHQHLASITRAFQALMFAVPGVGGKEEIFQHIRTFLDSKLVPVDITNAPLKLIIAGAPASGKGTQCEFIRQKYGVVHLSTGDMLREAVGAGTAVGRQAQAFMDSGRLVPDEIIIGVVQERLRQPDCQRQGWLLDGFPRTGAQADALIQNGIFPDAFIYLDVPDAVLVERVVGRRFDPVTGKIYHMKFSPPPTLQITARLTQRSDDTEEKVQVRLQAFHQHLGYMIDRFQKALYRVDGCNRMDSISAAIDGHLQSLRKYEIIFVLGGPGCGKGTQCAKISETFSYSHLSAGDLLREERAKNNSELGEQINEYIRNGQIVPAAITVRLLLAAMAAKFSSQRQRKFLIDGFPRNQENLAEWFVAAGSLAALKLVLVFDCPEKVMEQRLLKRGEQSGRVDDNIASIKKRFVTFKNDSMPVVQSFQRAGLARVVSSVPPPNVVFNKVASILRGIQVVPAQERTLAMIKPDAVQAGHARAIFEEIRKGGLVVVAAKQARLTVEQAGRFYAEHNGKPFFATLVQFMTSGPLIGIALEGAGAVKLWRGLMGPTNSDKARQDAPTSLRARFGTNGTFNATHGSDSLTSAMRELDFWFGENSPTMLEPDAGVAELLHSRDPRTSWTSYGLPLQDTIAAIKPETLEAHGAEIRDIILGQGFEIAAELTTVLTAHTAEQLHDTVTSQRELEYLSSGPITYMKLQREGAVVAWKALAGPRDPSLAKQASQFTIRARFGIDEVANAVHASDSSQRAAHELSFLFSLGQTTATNSAANTPAPDTSPSTRAHLPRELRSYVQKYVEPIFESLLQRLILHKPRDVVAFVMKELEDYQRLQAFPTLAPLASNGLKSNGRKLQVCDQIQVTWLSSHDPSPCKDKRIIREDMHSPLVNSIWVETTRGVA